MHQLRPEVDTWIDHVEVVVNDIETGNISLAIYFLGNQPRKGVVSVAFDFMDNVTQTYVTGCDKRILTATKGL